MSEETKKCPYCGEEILKEAKKCKHCGEWLEEKPSQSINKVDKQETTTKKEKTESSWNELSAIIEHPFRSLFVIAVLIFLFGNPFSDLNSIVQDNESRYCTKLKVAGGEKREFCSANEEDLKAFKNCVNNPALKLKLNYMANMTAESLTDKDYYAICKNINVYEINRAQEKQESKESDRIAKAVQSYHKAQTKAKAKEFGVSNKCAESYLEKLSQEGYIEGDIQACSDKENQAIRDYNSQLVQANYDNVPNIVYTDNGMPKSLVLKDVSIMCFEKANWGDNSSCSEFELNNIKKFFKENKNIDWEKEYFEY